MLDVFCGVNADTMSVNLQAIEKSFNGVYFEISFNETSFNESSKNYSMKRAILNKHLASKWTDMQKNECMR